MALAHGGNVIAAAAHFKIPVANWIDLSTGISPWTWPVPEVPEAVWRTLPQQSDGLQDAAAKYYGCQRSALLEVPGSQVALQLIPKLVPRARVALPLRGYAEHEQAWRKTGHEIWRYSSIRDLSGAVHRGELEYVVVINPNNPTTEMVERADLEDMRNILARRRGWLIVDEAFIDAKPEHSLASRCPAPGLVVLRSIGKFFGLAGMRLGFLLAPEALLAAAREEMTPWSVPNPARWLGLRALADESWISAQRRRLNEGSAWWQRTLELRLPELSFLGTACFVTGSGDAALCQQVQEACAKRALLLRVFDAIDDHNQLRFGLPLPAEVPTVLLRLEQALGEVRCATV